MRSCGDDMGQVCSWAFAALTYMTVARLMALGDSGGRLRQNPCLSNGISSQSEVAMSHRETSFPLESRKGRHGPGCTRLLGSPGQLNMGPAGTFGSL